MEKKKANVWVKIGSALAAIASVLFGFYQIARNGSVIRVEPVEVENTVK